MQRYNDKRVGFDREENVHYREIRFRPPISLKKSFMVMVEAGETFESLAFKYYGTEELWWVIADQNPLIAPLSLAAGMNVRVLRKRYLPGSRNTPR